MNGYFTTKPGSKQAEPGPVPLAVDPTTFAQVVTPLGSFSIKRYDSFEIEYVDGGNGDGEIETVTYKSGSETVGVLTFAYDAENRLTSVAQS